MFYLFYTSLSVDAFKINNLYNVIVLKNDRKNDRFSFRYYFFSKNDRFVFEKTRSFGKRTTRFENGRSLNEKRSFLIVFKESCP